MLAGQQIIYDLWGLCVVSRSGNGNPIYQSARDKATKRNTAPATVRSYEDIIANTPMQSINELVFLAGFK